MLDTLPAQIPPALRWPVEFCLFSSAATYVVSIITGNVSQVDRLWTFLPTIYSAYFALLPLWPNEQPFILAPYTPSSVGIVPGAFNPRALMMLGLILTWMFRLSYNTYRRGLFSLKDEDYRWAVLRSQLHPVLFHITNLTFISFIQNVLLLGLSVPAYIAATQPPQPLQIRDYFVIALTLVVLGLEFTADNQQYSYQTFKHTPRRYHEHFMWAGARLDWTKTDSERGFLTRGLWAWSRHPNFLCEQSFWWIMNFACLPSLPTAATFISIAKTPVFDLNTLLEPIIPFIPSIALSALFFSSTLYTEAITLSKYPHYRSYQARVGMFSPLDTIAKGIMLALSGKRAEVEREVWDKGKSE
ncbi:hypothetical protein MIND_00226700 [Mycena indigotica]|uniref:DUF1295-domain-containing protein n=1 Tax=Mycena indigotica TaxID=2126181 RepID=A0A8H6T6U3_9AGAR|nr:uncharacterized protein MIND_00226700 [Mycena indigotica]KAF7312143.1 hypothetical protein MIND_00226700 [Mycena indigotica]